MTRGNARRAPFFMLGCLLITSLTLAVRHLWSLLTLLLVDICIMDCNDSTFSLPQLLSPLQEYAPDWLGNVPAGEEITVAFSTTMDHTANEVLSGVTGAGSAAQDWRTVPSEAQHHTVIFLFVALALSEILALITYKLLYVTMEWYAINAIPGELLIESYGNDSSGNGSESENHQMYDAFFFPYWPYEDRNSNNQHIVRSQKEKKINRCLKCYRVDHASPSYKVEKRLMDLALFPMTCDNGCSSSSSIEKSSDENIDLRQSNRREMDEKNSSCSICLADYGKGDIVCAARIDTVCPHIFHKACIYQWLTHGRDNDSCPCCRKPLLQNPAKMHQEDRYQIELHQP